MNKISITENVWGTQSAFLLQSRFDCNNFHMQEDHHQMKLCFYQTCLSKIAKNQYLESHEEKNKLPFD